MIAWERGETEKEKQMGAIMKKVVIKKGNRQKVTHRFRKTHFLQLCQLLRQPDIQSLPPNFKHLIHLPSLFYFMLLILIREVVTRGTDWQAVAADAAAHLSRRC